MKNWIILSFSIMSMCLYGCNKEETKAVNKTDFKESVKEIPQTVDSGLQLSYVNENQNGVYDTSSTSISSAVAEAQLFAKQLDESTYRASLLQDKINVKIKKLVEVNAMLDSSIDKAERVHEFIVHNQTKEIDKYMATTKQKVPLNE